MQRVSDGILGTVYREKFSGRETERDFKYSIIARSFGAGARAAVRRALCGSASLACAGYDLTFIDVVACCRRG